jgi:acyl-coenzyme A thioesterase PaaI-like protein
MKLADYLGGRSQADGSWRFHVGRPLHGAFGGAFGGAVCAAALTAARPLAPGRRPVALDVQFLRQMPAGEAVARATRFHHGRSVSAVSVEIADERGRPCSRSTLSFADPDALEPMTVEAAAGEAGRWPGFDHAGARPMREPAGVEVPVIRTLAPRAGGLGPWTVATSIEIPWDEPGTAAEAACFAADFCVGAPVALVLKERWVPHPNPDLSLRFVGASDARTVVGVGRLDRVDAGVAAVDIEVRAGDALLAVGTSVSLLMRRPG